MSEEICGERLAEISRLEAAIDRQLPDRRKARVTFEWRDAVSRWVVATWDLARMLGPSPLDRETYASGMASAARPVFICGAHRSGTTFLRDLLDGHPALTVLPSEATFFTSLERKFAGLPSDAFATACGKLWLSRIANPNNQPPYWLLGRSTATGSPYLGFVREFLAWAAAPAADCDDNRTRALMAFALAYRRCLPGAEQEPDNWRWVDKTPGNERFLGRIWRDFAAAQVIHVIRRPADVVASHAALMRQAQSGRRGSNVALRDLTRSYLLACRHLRRAMPGCYRVVRYEQLVAEPREMMTGLAVFLEIDPAPILFRPTVNGRPTTCNTSFPDGERGNFHPTGLVERLHLAIAQYCYRRLLRRLDRPASRPFTLP